jgi:hypothetical protein
MKYHVSLGLFYDQLSIKSGGWGEGWVKYVFLGFRHQLRCQAEGKIDNTLFHMR